MLVRELATGTLTYTENITRNLLARDLDITIGYSGVKPNSFPCQTIRIDPRIPRVIDRNYMTQILRIFPALIAIKSCVSKYRPDIIFAQGLDEIGFVAVLASLIFGRPAISFVHDLTLNEFRLKYANRTVISILYGFSLFRQKLTVRRLSAVLVASNFMRDSLAKMFGKEPRITRLGVNEDFRQLQDTRPDKPFQLIFVGNLNRKKRPDIPIRTVAQLMDLDIRLVYVGDGPERSSLWRLVHALNLHDRVSFLGPLSKEDLLKELRKSHLCLVPSMWEGFGLAALEAMASGVPVIAADYGGLREIIKNGHNGYIIPIDKEDMWSQYVKQLYQDRDLRSKLSNNCVRSAQAFDWGKTAEMTIEVVRDVLSENRLRFSR